MRSRRTAGCSRVRGRVCMLAAVGTLPAAASPQLPAQPLHVCTLTPSPLHRVHSFVPSSDVEVFRRLYEEVGLGWVYSITKYKPVEDAANA